MVLIKNNNETPVKHHCIKCKDSTGTTGTSLFELCYEISEKSVAVV